jgi:hypothetical protein
LPLLFEVVFQRCTGTASNLQQRLKNLPNDSVQLVSTDLLPFDGFAPRTFQSSASRRLFARR